MEFKDRLKAARSHSKLTQGQLADAVGMTQTSISDLERGKSRATSFTARIAEVCGVSALWLEQGCGQMLADGAADNVGQIPQPAKLARAYPLISWVAAGSARESSAPYTEGVAEAWLTSTEQAGQLGYWLKVRGDSMTSNTPPSFPADTPILVQPEGWDLVSGKFYIARHRDGETTFKKYVRDSGIGYLVPLNPAYDTIRMDDDWVIIGRVIDAKITGL